jgi:DNA topoisomerase I
MTKKGISRKRKNGNKAAWNYYDESRHLIRDKKIIERCNKLVLPPAWEDVWISSSPRAHLQATGKDIKGRLQYKYHASWTRVRTDQKFNGIIAFAQALPAVRKKIKADLRLAGLPKCKVVALIITLIDRYHFRVGNDEYAKKNKSYGLTTLRKGHVRIDRSAEADGKLDAIFEFKGKSGKRWKKRIVEDDLALLVQASGQLKRANKSTDLFCYEDESGSGCDVKANHINEYLDGITSKYGKITSKGFRTWAATWKTAFRLSKQQKADTKYGKKRVANEVVKTVAEDLGNTAAVCRSSYIHPIILKDWMDGCFHETWSLACAEKRINGLSKEESATLHYLCRRNHRRARTIGGSVSREK